MAESTTVRQQKSPLWLAVTTGLTIFFAMSYILPVQAGMFSDLDGVTFGAIYIATAIASAVGTIFIGKLSNLPLAQSTGMGLNAFFVYTVCFTLGFTYQNALVFVLVDGIIFFILTITGLRRLIFDAIPKVVKVAISVGIGMFIALLGLEDAGIVVPSEATGLDLTSFNILGGNATPLEVAPKVITIITLVLIIALSNKKRPVPGAVLIGICVGTVLYYIAMAVLGGEVNLGMINLKDAFNDFANISLLAVFKEGFDFSAYLSTHTTKELILTFATTSLAFCMVDMFDTMGTLYGACQAGDLLVENEKGEKEVPNMNKAMLSDALATIAGAILGVSTVTTFVESSSGTAAGAKDRSTSYVVALCFILAIFFAPIASIVPASAYAAALIYVGILMFKGVADWDGTSLFSIAVGFITAFAMPATYNISYGICFGLVTYVLGGFLNNIVIEMSGSEEDLDKKVQIGLPTIIITLLFVVMLFTSR